MNKDYKAAFEYLMDFIKDIPLYDWRREELEEKLDEIFNNIHKAPKSAIYNAMKRLRDEFGFGIPD